MISAGFVFTLLMFIFILIGAMRGWQREVVAAAAVVLALFALQALNGADRITSLVAAVQAAGADPTSQLSAADRVKVNRFVALALPFLAITFFGYLGPTLTPSISSSRFGDRARSGLQGIVLGMIAGAINGWLILSTLARFAFNQGLLTDQGQFPSTGPAMFVPPPGGWAKFFYIESSAYVVLSGALLVAVLIVLFVFVLVAFI